MVSRLVALSLAAVPLLLFLGPTHATPAQLPKVTVSLPIAREVTDHHELTGRVEATEAVEVRSRLAGEVVEVAVRPGDVVKKGAVLFRLDARAAKLAVERAEGEAERAVAALRRATAELARAKRLAAAGPITKEDFEGAAAAHADAEAAVRIARAGVQLAQLTLEHATVTAPLAGKVSGVAASVGSVVAAAAPLVTVTATDRAHVTFDLQPYLALQFLRQAKQKKAVELTAQVGLSDEPDWPHSGPLDFNDLRIHPTTGVALVRVTVANPDGLFIPGFAARVRLLEGRPYKAQMVASRAFLNDDQGFYLLVVTGGGIVERRAVKIGRWPQGGLIAVKEGLKEKDQVVVALEQLNAMVGGTDLTSLLGTAVDPVKAPMPERAARQENPWGTTKGAFGNFTEKGGKGSTKGKRGMDPDGKK